MQTLEERLGYTFRNKALLEGAMIHSSYANEHRGGGICSNERLEFLGDAVLGLVAGEHLYRTHPDAPEGDLTRMRAALVREESLHEVARSLGLGEYLKLGRGEESGGGRQRPSILADATESVFAAVYLDGGMEPAVRLIHEKVLNHAGDTIQSRNRDNKTELQELVQQQPDSSIRYELTGESGPDHNKRFSYAVYVNGTLAGEGEGRTKKEAEQAAAGAALRNYRT